MKNMSFTANLRRLPQTIEKRPNGCYSIDVRSFLFLSDHCTVVA